MIILVKHHKTAKKGLFFFSYTCMNIFGFVGTTFLKLADSEKFKSI